MPRSLLRMQTLASENAYGRHAVRYQPILRTPDRVPLCSRAPCGGIVQRRQILGLLIFASGGGLVVLVYARHYATKLVVNKNKEVRQDDKETDGSLASSRS